MDVIDRLHAAVKASGMRKKTIAERAGLKNASALSRILHKHVKPRHHELEAIAATLGRTLSSFYPDERLPVGVTDAREALRVLADFVEQHDTTKVSATQAPPAAAQTKSPRSRVVRPFHAAANPNAILLDSSDDED